MSRQPSQQRHHFVEDGGKVGDEVGTTPLGEDPIDISDISHRQTLVGQLDDEDETLSSLWFILWSVVGKNARGAMAMPLVGCAGPEAKLTAYGTWWPSVSWWCVSVVACRAACRTVNALLCRRFESWIIKAR